MFRPIAAIIRFSSESMVVVLYRIGMVMSRWRDLNICGAFALGCVCTHNPEQKPTSSRHRNGKTVAGDPHRTAVSRRT